jgi:peptidoglycan L-alanyl-D-glutamate endopeptidase CwlK
MVAFFERTLDMSNSTARDGDVSKLHPAIRDKVAAIQKKLKQEKIPFEVFEAFRTPERQAELYAKGRSKPGRKVTWVNSWGSIHQYGLAVDFVLKINGKWSWDDSGPEAAYWKRMHVIALENDMTPLYNSAGRLIEKPHVQLKGVSGTGLYKGHYPRGGDQPWAEKLSTLIDNWEGSIPAPPKPSETPERPAINDADAAEMEAEMSEFKSLTSTVPATTNSAASDEKFKRLHGFIAQSEGGWSNHPEDNGGATNMGITRQTLANWRGKDVSVNDVKNLTRAEADLIFRTRYFSACRCGEMPDRMAMVTYNGAVLHGPKRSIEMVQQAFNDLGMKADGEPLEVDGIIGRMTMTAIKQTHPSALSEVFLDIQEQHFRDHEDFATFGKGWMNRTANLREFLTTLPAGEGKKPRTVMKISDNKLDLDLEALLLKGLGTASSGGDRNDIVRAVLRAALANKASKASDDSVVGAILGELVKRDKEPAARDLTDAVLTTEDGRPPLTPVNAALGNTVGRALNGKKSVTGILGLLTTVLLPKLGISGDIVTFINGNGQLLLTLFSMVTGWGFLGKIDKAIRTVNTLRHR